MSVFKRRIGKSENWRKTQKCCTAQRIYIYSNSFKNCYSKVLKECFFLSLSLHCSFYKFFRQLATKYWLNNGPDTSQTIKT